MTASFISEAERILGYSFKNKDILHESLTHPSCMGDRGATRSLRDYERLEFLGDAVLGFVVAEMLFKLFPNEDEGSLSRRQTALVRGSVISEVASKIGIGNVIIMSNSEKQSSGDKRKSNLENVFEAIIGAIYLDGGIDVVTKFINVHLFALANKQMCPVKDPKTRLQESVQRKGLEIPLYKIVERCGLDHMPMFKVEVYVSGYEHIIGSGKSRKAAEMDAAENMLKIINGSPK